MSLWRDELKPAPGTLASLAALAGVTVASLGRVIEAPGYVVWAISALTIGAAFAMYFGRRSLGVGFALCIAFSIASLPPLFLRGADQALLPTPGAMSDVRALIANAFDAIPQATPPVPAQPRFLILVWISLLLLGFLCAAWVVVRRPVGAVVSLLAVVTFTGSVGEGSGRNVIAVAAVATTGVFFLSEGRHRISRWGGGRISIPAWLGLPTLGIACVVAIGAPLVLGETPIVKLQSAIRPRVVIIKPLSDIRRQLRVDPPLEVMRVTSPRPTYWRLTGLDAYDGAEWVLEARPRDVQEGQIRDAEPPTTGDLLEQNYRLTSLLSPWLPAAYAATTIDTEEAVQLDEGSQTLLLRDDLDPGLQYTVTSRLPRATENRPADLRVSDDPLARAFLGQAQRITAGAQTPIDIARRLEEHFHAYEYSEDVVGGHSVQRLQRFLVERRGYCEQFAAAMTLMLRSIGVEARVGVGFLPGAVSGGEYIVSTRDAHAWVEANIPGTGWISFDPTPGRAESSSIPPETEDAPATPEPVPEVTAVPDPTPQQEDLPEDVLEEPGLVGSFPTEVLWAMLGVAVLATPPVAKSVRRKRRQRGPPDAVVVGAYDEFVDRARDLGRRQQPSETVREFAVRVLEGDPSASQLATLSALSLYGPGTTTPEQARDAWRALRAADRVMAKRTPWYRKVVAFFDPRTFIPDQPFRGVRTRVSTALGRA